MRHLSVLALKDRIRDEEDCKHCLRFFLQEEGKRFELGFYRQLFCFGRLYVRDKVEEKLELS